MLSIMKSNIAICRCSWYYGKQSNIYKRVVLFTLEQAQNDKNIYEDVSFEICHSKKWNLG